MHIQYDGTAYLGFASQDLQETVENHLFNALTKLKLIEDRKVPCYLTAVSTITCLHLICRRVDRRATTAAAGARTRV